MPSLLRLCQGGSQLMQPQHPCYSPLPVTTFPGDPHNVLSHGADPHGAADSSPAIQRTIDIAAGHGGGTVYLPAGIYVLRSGPIQPRSGVRVLGDGYLATQLVSTSSNAIFTMTSSSLLDNIEIDHLTLRSRSSHLLTGARVARLFMHDCRLIQESFQHAIWLADPVLLMIECRFERNTEEIHAPSPRTLDAWYLASRSGRGQINHNVWRDNVCFNVHADPHAYWYHLLQRGADQLNESNRFENIVFEHCSGGAILTESAAGTLIDGCRSYDTAPGSIERPLFRFQRYSGAGVPQGNIIHNSGRYGTGLRNGTADISLDRYCTDTVISGCGCNRSGAPFVVDLGGSSRTTVTGIQRTAQLRNPAKSSIDASDFPGVQGATAQPEDLGFAGWAFDPAAIQPPGSAIPSPGVVYLIKTQLRMAAQISRIRLYVTSSGHGLTSGRNYIGLYDPAGDLIAASKDQSLAWATTGEADVILPGAPFQVSDEFVWVALLAHGTKLPALAATSSLTPGMSNGYLPVHLSRYARTRSGQMTLPAAIRPHLLTPTATQWWAAIG